MNEMRDLRIRLHGVVSGMRAVAAILTRRSALSGPRMAVMILSGECNSRCIMCWYHSPLLDGDECAANAEPRAPSRFMDRRICETILRQCAALGTHRIVFGGHGEPTLHPSFDDLLRRAGDLGMAGYVITNGLSAEPSRAAFWATQYAHFRFSLHAGDPDTWLAIHPHSSVADFERIERAIKILVKSRSATVSAMHVLQRGNLASIRETVRHAHRLGLHRLLYMPVRADGPRTPVLLNDAEQLELRQALVECRDLAARWGIRTNLAELLNTNCFTRSGVPRTTDLYRQVPCHIGYVYTEFDLEGHMRPCEGSEIIIGRAGDDDIAELWRSEVYEEFRRRATPVPGCACDSCTMTQFNLNIHRLLHLRSFRHDDD